MFSNDVGLFKEAKKGRIGGLISSVILCYVFIFSGEMVGLAVQNIFGRFLPNNPIMTQINGDLWRNLFTIVLLALWVTFKEKRKFSTIGFTRENFFKKYFLGFLFGFIMFTTVILILKSTGHIVVDTNSKVATGMSALTGIILVIPAWIIQSASEEIVTRGWLMHVLGAKYNVMFGLIASAALFGILHLLNPGISIIAVLNITLVGIFFGLYIIKSRNIWGACGMHAAWNWAQGNLYGFEVSGNKAAAGNLFSYKAIGADWFTGGNFGPEAGFAATIVLCLAIVILLVVTRNKESI